MHQTNVQETYIQAEVRKPAPMLALSPF